MKDKPLLAPILIFRRGSIGDAVVSIPALNEIARRHADVERWIIGNTPIMETAASVADVLDNTTLVTGFISLPPGGGGWTAVAAALERLRALGARRLYYLSEPSRGWARIRERAFFRLAGIRETVGRPDSPDTAAYRPARDGLWESETQRLLRIIGGDPEHPDWTFPFLAEERRHARALVDSLAGAQRHILFSLGAKLPDKDWGERNWRHVLGAVSAAHPALGLVAIGAADEAAITARALESWHGPTLNLCGKTPPRISALLGEKAAFYLGHDSGPMHLAALVGTPCVAIFSARAKPGVWFPRGTHNRIFYPLGFESSVPARTGFRTAGESIASIAPEPVVQACLALLASTTAA